MRFVENQLILDVLPDDDTDRSSGCPAWSMKLKVPADVWPAVPLNRTNWVAHPPESAMCGK